MHVTYFVMALPVIAVLVFILVRAARRSREQFGRVRQIARQQLPESAPQRTELEELVNLLQARLNRTQWAQLLLGAVVGYAVQLVGDALLGK
ncbi:hypothetical protein SAMN05421833_103255 [Microbispora rosea]|uniref:Uncharacterized protein n=1 Tax=Microbispora rosea TaxID=58117 RepID=A0A1N6V374_9ACTN|nr:hypothetical protein [Microbispora rosea]GIH46756.1 hypothetical protein Mro03_19350 [Microbispora rosea subsp. rosea]SIQ72325.1 hypothetical protein SAMN05421833_103255 [Microbispora rosea]